MMKIKLNDMIVSSFVFGDLFQSQKRDELPVFFFSSRLSQKVTHNKSTFDICSDRRPIVVLHCFNDLQ